MTYLECSARNCLYNDSDKCCKGDIKVAGQEAKNPDDTCCGSFKERRTDVYSNVSGQPSDHIAVKCSAVNCVFNKSEECSAKHIGIGGSRANRSEETECTSFRLS